MKRFTLMAGLVLALAVSVTAQTTKVSKKIEVLPWLNSAVINANQAEGGLHSYVDWATLGTDLKLAQVKVGMLVTIGTDADANLKGTFRLKAWAIQTALPVAGEWEKVSDMVIVADLTARDALIVTDNTKVSLAPGTTVMVKDNGKGAPATFIYVAGLVDVNAPTGIDAADLWYSTVSSGSDGYIFFELAAVGATSSGAANGWYKAATASGAITIGTTARLAGMPADAEFALTAGDNVPVVAIPAAWANPTFYLNDGTTTSQLLDCWVKTYQTIDGIQYQVWTADNTLLKGLPGSWKLFVR